MNRQLTITERVDNMIMPHNEQLTSLLGEVVDPQKFKAAVIVACQKNKDILRCDPNSIVQACMTCAQDGLIPDGRLAALVPFWQKFKDDRGQWQKIKVATYMPMVAGILKRARDFSDFHNIVCDVVCKNDTFSRRGGDNPTIEHDYPDLGEERGPIIGAYAIFKDKAGRVIHREVMDKKDLAKVKAVSKAGDKVWGPWEDEMSKKSVIRRGAKRIPMSDELRDIVERDDQFVDLELPTTQQPTLAERLAAKQQTEPTDEGFNQDTIQDQLDSASEPHEDVMDVEPEDEKPETAEEPQELSDKQQGFLKDIETALKGCRTVPDLDTEVSKFNDDVEAGGQVLIDAAQKLYYSRRAELEQ